MCLNLDRSVPVMIVDDFDHMRTLLRDMLDILGLRCVDEASDGAEALAKIRATGEHRLVISDWNMESMSGLDLLKSMQADESLKHLPFVMMSSARGSESVAAARRAGAGSYLDKPFNIEALRAAICEALDLPCQPMRQQN